MADAFRQAIIEWRDRTIESKQCGGCEAETLQRVIDIYDANCMKVEDAHSSCAGCEDYLGGAFKFCKSNLESECAKGNHEAYKLVHKPKGGR